MNKDEIKKYLKKYLRIEANDGKIELRIENELISAVSLNKDTNEIENLLICDCCGAKLPESQFCFACSEIDVPVCVSCCSCFL